MYICMQGMHGYWSRIGIMGWYILPRCQDGVEIISLDACGHPQVPTIVNIQQNSCFQHTQITLDHGGPLLEGMAVVMITIILQRYSAPIPIVSRIAKTEQIMHPISASAHAGVYCRLHDSINDLSWDIIIITPTLSHAVSGKVWKSPLHAWEGVNHWSCMYLLQYCSQVPGWC